jgi:mannose-6-phosphate isomerase-like protein (cupin superfamily)
MGCFTWHHHEQEDEMFYVVQGEFVMELRDQNIPLSAGDFLIVPKGVEHRPNAAGEVWVMLFEPAGTLNTGNTENAFTQKNLETL